MRINKKNLVVSLILLLVWIMIVIAINASPVINFIGSFVIGIAFPIFEIDKT